jgi:hypothetical protein
MANESIYKLQPNRTMYLRGFDRRGAAVAFHSATNDEYKLSGVFRDFADFAVHVIWDADDFFNHITTKWLPDFDFSGMVLEFDLDYNDQLQGIESPKNAWISWDSLSYIRKDGSSGTIKLWDHAELQSGSFSPASATWTISAGATLNSGDQLTFYYLDIPFDYSLGTTSANFTYFAGGLGTAHTVRVSGLNLQVANATNASPIQITTTAAHSLTTGDVVTVAGVGGNTAANGAWFITVIDATNFTLSSSAGNGAYTSGGKVGLRRVYTFTETAGLSGRDVASGVAAAFSGDPWVVAASFRGNPIVGATNASPIRITTTNPHYLITGNAVDISGVGGNTAANGAFIITRVSDTEFTLDGSVGSGAYTSGGSIDQSNVCFISGAGSDGTEILVDDATDGNGAVTIFNVSAAGAVQSLVNQINQYNWPFESPAMAIIADNPSGTDLRVKAGRYGIVDASGTAVTWVSGQKFTGLAASSKIHIDGVQYTISAVNSPTSLTLSGSAGSLSGKRYLAEYGGWDGNMIEIQCRSKNANLTTSGASTFGAYRSESKQLTGGNSDVVWHISIDFTALGIDSLRQLWMTYAPKMANNAAYVATEFEAEFTNLAVTDPGSKRELKVAHPQKSVLVSSRDARARLSGSGWVQEAGFYYQGFAKGSSTLNDKVTIRYSCQHAHKLFLGTSLYVDRGIMAVEVDGIAYDDLDAYLSAEPPIVTRRQIGLTSGASNTFAAGIHTVVLTIKHEKNIASTGYIVYFDYLQAAVESDVQDPLVVHSDRSAAIDYGTNHGYSLPPARLMWMFDRVGLQGPMNEYISVFWWNQRQRVSGTNREYDVQFSGTWAVNDSATFTLSGINVSKTLRTLDVDPGDATIAHKILAQTLADRVNAQFSGVWAEVVGSGLDTVRIHPRTAIFSFTVASSKSSSSGVITATGNLDPGSEGVWQIDPSITPRLNKAATEWHKDFYAEAATRSREVTTAVSMELLNPPEDPSIGEVWSSRFPSGIEVLTDTGFGTEAQAAITGATNASPIVIAAAGHGYRNGDPIRVTGVGGNTAANGTWPITVVDADHFSLNGSTGNGSYTSGGVSVRLLKTTHCTFSDSVADYQKEVFKEIAGLMDDAGLTPWLQCGEFLWWFFPEKVYIISGATNASPIVITAPGHTFSNGEWVTIAGVRGNTAANGTWVVANKTSTTFELQGSVGNGAYVAAPDSFRIASARGKGMAFYDDYTTAAASTALGRALHTFYTQDDSDVASHSADTAFLANQLKLHIDAIITYVKATYPGANFELLFPYDVNNATMYSTLDVPYPQGGRVNFSCNWPDDYQLKATSGLDRIKMEGLSWGITYHNLDKSLETMLFPATAPNGWSKADYRVLLPWHGGSCPWKAEYLNARRKGLGPITFWAFDQFCIFSWPVPLPEFGSDSAIF